MSWAAHKPTGLADAITVRWGSPGLRADLFLLRNKDASFEAKFEARARLLKAHPSLLPVIDEFMQSDDVTAIFLAETAIGVIENTQ